MSYTFRSIPHFVVITILILFNNNIESVNAFLPEGKVVRNNKLTRQRTDTLDTRIYLTTITTNTDNLFKSSVYETILSGKIAVIPEFLSYDELQPLRYDAQSLYENNLFSTDALASYGTNGKFDPSKDRAVLKLNQWKNNNLGNYEIRKQFGVRIGELRADLSKNLNRPALVQGDSVQRYGNGSTEISYTRFGPGAYLKRHVDEHHEELKGNAGWIQPTRRSLSWLIYLNDNWNADKYGGCLRCYERTAYPPSHPVGARPNGDLQIGWLRPTLADPIERPVFMDAQYNNNNNNKDGGICAMYIDNDDNVVGGNKQYITKNFNPHPILYISGGEYLTQKLLITNRRDLADRFRVIEPPKSRITDWLNANMQSNNDDENAIDIPPLGGTLVIFDSVSLPHEVLPTISRERWATSGWMHEDQQSINNHPHYNNNNIV